MKESIEILIGMGKIEDAISQLLLFFKTSHNNENYNSLLLQSARFYDNEREKKNNLISLDSYRQTKAQIIDALQYYMNDLTYDKSSDLNNLSKTNIINITGNGNIINQDLNDANTSINK